MKAFLCAALTLVFVTAGGFSARADEKDPNAVLDKAIKAAGGEEKLKKLDAMTWKSKASITFNGDSNPMTFQATVQGLDRYRTEFEGEFGGNSVKGLVVLNGNKGWRRFGEEKMDMDDDAVANEKRRIYLQVIPNKLVILKDKGYKLEAADEQKVGDKPAAGIKVTGPDGKDFTIYFDKESGLPVRVVAKVVGFDNQEYTEETTRKDFKDVDGIKIAMKSESKRDGEDFFKSEITEFKALDKVEAKTFDEP
jgi:outer membrane lipoprotein-sorting protein